MAMFGKSKGGLSLADRIAIFGAAYEGDTATVDAIRKRRAKAAQEAAIQKAAMQAAGLIGPAPGAMRQVGIGNQEGEDISAAFAPQMEQGPARRRSPDEVAAGLAQITATTPGFNPKAYVDLAQYSRPNLMVTPSGEAIDQYDPSNAGRVFPKLGEGIQRTRDGAVAVPGYAEANASIKGAETGAQERAKAQLDVISINQPDGSTVQVPRDVAVQALLQSMATGSKTGLGQSQTPGAKIKQEGDARTAVDRAAVQPQQYAGLQDQARVSDQVRKGIHELLGDTLDPKTGRWTAGGSVSPIGGGGDLLSGSWTTGFGANLAGISGTKSHDLKAKLDTLRAITTVEELQKMRANSPTGGALGSVSERENDMLAALRSSLDQGQSPAQLKASLRAYLDQAEQIARQRSDLYRNTYGDTAAPLTPGRGGAGGPRTAGKGYRILSVE